MATIGKGDTSSRAGRTLDGMSRASSYDPTSSANGTPLLRSPLALLDVHAVSESAKRETRNREIRLPPISVFRWWARRTESVFGSIIDAFSAQHPGKRLEIADPFAGGGTIPLAALVRGHRVYAQDLNPWAAHGLVAMLGLPRSAELVAAAKRLEALAEADLRAAYETRAPGGEKATLVHTFRVATEPCSSCATRIRLFPHALVSLVNRKERGECDAFLACPAGHLFRGDSSYPVPCTECSRVTDPAANYTPGRRVRCWSCGAEASLEDLSPRKGLRWDVVLVERAVGPVRELDFPTPAEVRLADGRRWKPRTELEAIPPGQETSVLLRHGFRTWGDLYPRRQRCITERMLELAPEAAAGDENVLRALRFAIVGSTEMAGYLSRWDRYYKKSYEAMAGHRFNFTTFAVEPNVWGAGKSGRGTTSRRLAAFVEAAEWLEERVGHAPTIGGPYDVGRTEGRLSQEERGNDANVAEGTSETLLLADDSVDLVLTDPPYHDDVQYGELSLPLRAWEGLATSALGGEAVVNPSTGQNTEELAYRHVLTLIFAEVRRTLRPDGHLIFTYANRSPEAWAYVLAALRDAGFRACGYEIVHSENETDYAKRGVRTCTMDLVLDLVPTSNAPLLCHVPTPEYRGEVDEVTFLRQIGATLMRLEELENGWEADFMTLLRRQAFLANDLSDASGR
jgi:16S rRNA G966 N2-methylase RsmD